MLSYNELKIGTLFIKDEDPWQVLEYSFVRMQQRKPVAQLKIKNLVSGKVVEYTAHQNDSFKEADIETAPVKFLYMHRDEYWFVDPKNLKDRFMIKEELLGNAAKFLKPNTEVRATKFDDRVIGVELPVKMDFKVTEAPPAIKGNTAQGGTKLVTIETGAKINVPLFINEDDVVRVNTETGEYVERAEKN
ncbi:MAG: elongation factor P [Patescibacteria group bacterium]